MRLSDLPESLRHLVELIGWEAAIRLAETFGGITYDMPRHADSVTGERLTEVIGRAATDRLLECFGGTSIYLPMAATAIRRVRDRAIVADYSAGTGVNELVQKYRLCDRQIWVILKKTDCSAADKVEQGVLF
ncbi:MAG: Mor transcription activator family protein [Sulfuricellaceae bacterium]|nr:Mor transcription activator family protein [Sulfuricellaceae bacterium]